MNIKKMSIVVNNECGEPFAKDFNIAIFSAEEVANAIKEFELFRNRKGKTWTKALSVFEPTCISDLDFINVYFGEFDGDFYLNFDGFQDPTHKLKKLFSMLEYHNTFKQEGISLESYGDIVIINRFNY